MSDYEGVDGDVVRSQGAAGVEAEPAEPEQHSPQHHHSDVMRRHGLFAVAQAPAEDEGRCQRRHAGVDVDDGAAGEVEGAAAPQVL